MDTSPEPAAGRTARAGGGHRVTVLLIDDQAIIGEAVRRMLAGEEDIEFHFCQDPAKAIQTAVEVKPTVILQDLVMPEIDGLTLVRFLRAHEATKEIPLIVLSSREEPVTKAEAFELGANDYLVKLPDRIELLARIRYHSQGYIRLLERNAVMKQLEEELRQAAEYVFKMLPAPLETGPVRARWSFVPSTSLGGDAFGYHWLDERHLAIYLIDVCGHGVGAALLSVSVMNVLRAKTLPNVDFHQPDQVLAGLNDSFPMEKHNDMFFTAWYGVYDRVERELAYASGGHPPALLFPAAADGSDPRELETKNLIIGGMPDMTFQKASVHLPGPARLYVYSDGVYEITDAAGKVWSYEEFVAFMKKPENPESTRLEQLFQHAVARNGSNRLDDDFSIVELDFE